MFAIFVRSTERVTFKTANGAAQRVCTVAYNSVGPQAVPDQLITAPYFAHGKISLHDCKWTVHVHGKYNYRLLNVQQAAVLMLEKKYIEIKEIKCLTY